MSEEEKVKKVELYIFDDIDSREIQLQDIDGDIGVVSVTGSVVKHRVYDDKGDHKVMTETSINLSNVSQAKRFRYATDDSKPDGIGIIMRGENNDFVFTSTQQKLSNIYKEIESKI